MPIDSAEKRPYYVLIETDNALEGKTMIRIHATTFDGCPTKASVEDILFGDFLIDTRCADGLFSPVDIVDVESAEFEDQYADWCETLRR